MNKDVVVATYEERRSIGDSFISIARSLLTSGIRSKLVALKDFEFVDPGLDYPAWKLDAVNRLKNRQIEAILA